MALDIKVPATARARARSRRAIALSLALAALAVAGCRDEEGPTRVAGWSLIDPAQRHPILVRREPEHLKLSVARGSHGLSPAQKAEVADFAARARAADAGNTKLVIAAPAGADNEIEAARAVDQIRYVLSESGIAETAVGLEGYSANGERTPPVRVSFTRYVAQAPECGNWPTNLAREPQNLPYHNFGCATNRNFGNMVANPADLIEPRSETDRSSERRGVVWGKYVKGDHTGADRPPDKDEKLTTTIER